MNEAIKNRAQMAFTILLAAEYDKPTLIDWSLHPEKRRLAERLVRLGYLERNADSFRRTEMADELLGQLAGTRGKAKSS